jgi:glycerate kinase
MKIVIAPDKFKGSLTALEAADAIALGVRRALPAAEIDLCPLADGGEGTVAALVAATNGTLQTRRVTGPLPDQKVDAAFGILGDQQTAVIEMAAASGLALLAPDERDPFRTTTFGTGELLMAAAALDVRRIILGIGGSATVDGGIGCAQACGLPVLLDGGEPVSPTEPLTGADLERVVLIKHDRGSLIERVELIVACDVTNPLYGPAGAAQTYGPQKGASPLQVAELDRWLQRLAERTGKTAEALTPGAGAAGGLGFAMLAFFGARLCRGIDIVIEATQLRRRLVGADLCITGEGRLDASSLHGKAPLGVARLCREMGIPCFALVGSVEPGVKQSLAADFAHCHCISDGSISTEHSMRDAKPLLATAAEQLMRHITAGNG